MQKALRIHPRTRVISHTITSSADPASSNASTPISNVSVNITDNDVTLTPIYKIQGSGTASPLVGSGVTSEGVVVGDFQGSTGLNGFYIQDRTGYDNSSTSDGIFVFAPNSINVIMGDQNADPFDGNSTNNAIRQLLDNILINTSATPRSAGEIQQAELQGDTNEAHKGNPAFDTADFADSTPENLRVDYVLPSDDLGIANC